MSVTQVKTQMHCFLWQYAQFYYHNNDLFTYEITNADLIYLLSFYNTFTYINLNAVDM